MIRLGETYLGVQGITYGAVVFRNITDSEKVFMNVLPMAQGVHSIPHIHKEIKQLYTCLKESALYFTVKN